MDRRPAFTNRELAGRRHASQSRLRCITRCPARHLMGAGELLRAEALHAPADLSWTTACGSYRCSRTDSDEHPADCRRGSCNQFVVEADLRAAVQLARSGQPECGSILVLFDTDDDCPKELAAGDSRVGTVRGSKHALRSRHGYERVRGLVLGHDRILAGAARDS